MEFNTLGFLPEFDCRIISGSSRCPEGAFQFGPRHVGRPPRAGTIVEVLPSVGERWLGWFESDVPHFLSGVFACPSERDLLVVNGGKGYLVSAARPSKFEILARPVRGVARVPEMPLMLIWDEQDVMLYGRSGMIWWVERVAEEALRIDSITPKAILGHVPNFTAGTEQSITIDVATGDVNGAWLRHGPGNVVYPAVHHAQPREHGTTP